VARCLLPEPLAAALRTEPQLISELAEVFYRRCVTGAMITRALAAAAVARLARLQGRDLSGTTSLYAVE
jgi:hypothetical protein